MKQFRPCVDFSLFVICALLGLSSPISVHGEDVPKGGPSKSLTTVPDGFDIYGTLIDITSDTSQESLAKLSASKTGEDFAQAITGIFKSCPAPNVVVTMQSESVSKKTVTDLQGNFKFIGLPRGVYEVSAAMPSQPSGTGIKRMATARERVRLDSDSNRRVELRLRADLVAVKGRITDVHGRPIAGAKVNAIEKIYDQQYLENHDPRMWSAISKADGYYELQELEPTSLYRIAGYLQEGSPRALDSVDIHVEADGFVQDKANVPRVPLVTEELLGPARRFLKAESQMATRNGGSELREKDGLSIPSSHGNTITGIDIVLKKVGE